MHTDSELVKKMLDKIKMSNAAGCSQIDAVTLKAASGVAVKMLILQFNQ